MVQVVGQPKKDLFLRLGAIVFFGELAHGMMLYGIIPALVRVRFPNGIYLFDLIHVKAELAGLCLATYVVAELLCKLPAGLWVDSKGPDAPVRLGLVLSMATVPLILGSHVPSLMLLGSALHGVGASPIWPAVISTWTRGRSAKERAGIMGQILTMWMAGIGLGIIIGNLLVTLTGKREILMAMYGPLSLWAITLIAALWAGKRLGVAAHMDPNLALEDEAPQAMQITPALRTMTVGLFIQNLAFGCMILPFNFMAVDHLFVDVMPPRLRTTFFALMILLGAGPAVLMMAPMGRIADRLGRRKSVILAMLAVAPLIAVAPFVSFLPVEAWQRLAVMIPGLLVAASAYALLLPAWHALALGQIAEQQRGRCMALLMSIEMVAMACGHIVGPLMYERVWFGAPFVLAGIVFGLLGLVYAGGYILPPDSSEEPHRVDLGAPNSPSGAGREGKARDPLPGHPY